MSGDAGLLQKLGARSIVLVGMMGCGKSSVGRRLAQRLGRPFVDTDSAVEEAAQSSISEIFATYGEQAFRDGERRVVRRVLEAPSLIVALGGGAFLDAETRVVVAERAVSVFIDVSPSDLFLRLSRRAHRPLLAGADIAARVESLLAVRRPIYESADLRIAGAPDLTATTKAVQEALGGWARAVPQSGLEDGLTCTN